MVSDVKGAITGRWVAGERRGERAASQGGCCLLPVASSPSSAWSPAGETHAGAKPNPKGPHSLQGLPLRQGGGPWYQGQPGAKPGRQIPQTQPCPRLGMLLGRTPKPRGTPAPHTGARPRATRSGSQGCRPSNDAHLARAALLPTLLLTGFQHLKEAQESPELNLQPGPGAGTARRGWGDSRDPREMKGKEERPRSLPVPSSWLWTRLRRGTPPPSPSGMRSRQGPGSHPHPGAGNRPHMSGGCGRRCGRPARGWENTEMRRQQGMHCLLGSLTSAPSLPGL